MKKLIVLLSLVFMYSCTSQDQDDTNSGQNNSSVKISPPEWIRGTWNDGNGKELEFTKSDILCDFYGTSYYSAKNGIETSIHLDIDPEVTQTQTDSTYILQYRESASSKRKYSFNKISDTQIESSGAFKGIYNKK